MEKKENKQETIVINVKEIKEKVFTIIDAGYLNSVDDWYDELQRDVAEESIKRNYWDFEELGDDIRKDDWKALKERYNKTDLLDALVEYVMENYEDPCEYVSDIFVEIEEVDTDGWCRGYANVCFNGINDITYERHFESSVEELDTIIDEYNIDKENKVPQFIGENGQVQVTLTKEGKSKNVDVAFLVASSFVPNPQNLPYVRHKDGNRMNNAATNLEWSSIEEH